MTEVHLQEKEASIGPRGYRRRRWQMSNIVEKNKRNSSFISCEGMYGRTDSRGTECFENGIPESLWIMSESLELSVFMGRSGQA